jgi:hypothetical protein
MWVGDEYLVWVALNKKARVTSPTRLKAVAIALQALLLVEKAEPVQTRFTLRLMDQ